MTRAEERDQEGPPTRVGTNRSTLRLKHVRCQLTGRDAPAGGIVHHREDSEASLSSTLSNETVRHHEDVGIMQHRVPCHMT